MADLTAGRLQIQEKALDTGKWQATSGTWGIITDTQQDGSVGGVAQVSIGSSIRQALLSSYQGSDYVLEAYGKQLVGGVWGLGVRATDQDSLDLVSLDGTDDQLKVTDWVDGIESSQTGTATGAVDANTWYKLSIKAYGNKVDVYKDDVLALQSTGSTGLGNSIALYGANDTVAEFNNVLVRKYAATEPSVTVIIDTAAPSVTGFVATTPTNKLNIPITTFTATDNSVVNSYLITQSATPPSVGDANWSGTPPTTYTVASDGSYTLYPRAQDDAGNVSAVFGSPRTVVVDTTPPTVTDELNGLRTDQYNTDTSDRTIQRSGNGLHQWRSGRHQRHHVGL